jgi:large subunit ribosomal protein L35
MPKLKTHKGAQKRFKVTAKKKVLHSKANKSHILTKKASKRKRHLGKKKIVSRADRATVKKMIPYEF